MAEHYTAAIFEELRRIGVELDRVSEPLVATGFTRASLLEWLQRIPTGAGSEELARRLDVYAVETLATLERVAGTTEPAAQLAGPDDPQDGPPWWPTIEMLDAGIHVLADEWDPIGTRLGGVPIEDIGEHVFHLFGPLLQRWHGGDPLVQVSELIAAIEEEQLGLRRSPLIHRRYLAARLQKIAHRCETPETEREHIAGLDSLYEPPRSAESRSWDDVIAFIRLVLTARDDAERGAEITDAMLAELASEIVADADAMDGPMPDEVERFVQRHTPFTPPMRPEIEASGERYTSRDRPPASPSDQH